MINWLAKLSTTNSPIGIAVCPKHGSPHKIFLASFTSGSQLVMTGGREQTEAKFHELYEKSGFRLTRIVPTESPFNVIEGVKV